MDELWQRYRTFWTPVLIGTGIFLIGLIAVHVVSDDPATAEQRAFEEARRLSSKQEPTAQDIQRTKAAATALGERVETWARRLDQARLEDPLAAAVDQALGAAILRGIPPERLATVGGGGAYDPVLQPFDGDATQASRALARYQAVRQDRMELLRTGDPNVGFSRLLNDVWSELRVRANRADVELKSDMLGFGSLGSISRANLLQRMLNLALAARVVDLAIRRGVRSIDDVRLENRAVEQSDLFLREWPVTFVVTGDMQSVQPIVAMLTDPAAPVPIAPPGCQLAQPRRGSPLEGLVELQVTASSVLVRPEARLDLQAEEPR